MSDDRHYKRDPGDPDGPIGEAYPGPGPAGETGDDPVPIDETGEDPVAWEGRVDRFLATLFPDTGLDGGASEPGE